MTKIHVSRSLAKQSQTYRLMTAGMNQTFSISGCATEEVDAAVTHNVLIRVLSRLKG